MTNKYYSDTAYDSTQNRFQAPFDKKRKLNFAERTIRKDPLSIPNGQCREYLAQSSTVEEFQNAGPTEQQELDDRKLHEYLGWETSENKASVVKSFSILANYIWKIAIIVSVLIGILFGFDISWVISMSLLAGIPFSIWFFGNYALKHN